MIEIVGWLGTFCFAVCGLPQLIKILRTKETGGVSVTFLFLWLIGEILTLWYAFVRAPKLPLLTNYVWNITVVFLILFFYAKYRNRR